MSISWSVRRRDGPSLPIDDSVELNFGHKTKLQQGFFERELYSETGTAVAHDRDGMGDVETHEQPIGVRFQIPYGATNPTATSLSTIIVRALHCVGLILPGVIEDPRSLSGITSS